MNRWMTLIVLLVAVVASGVWLVALKHQGRQLFIELEQAGQAADQAQVEWSRLQIELAWLGETGRIEQQAMEQLNMTLPKSPRALVAEHE